VAHQWDDDYFSTARIDAIDPKDKHVYEPEKELPDEPDQEVAEAEMIDAMREYLQGNPWF
jgi:hypothetical protein